MIRNALRLAPVGNRQLLRMLRQIILGLRGRPETALSRSAHVIFQVRVATAPRSPPAGGSVLGCGRGNSAHSVIITAAPRITPGCTVMYHSRSDSSAIGQFKNGEVWTALLHGGPPPLEKSTLSTQQELHRLTMSGKSGVFEAPSLFSTPSAQNRPDLWVCRHPPEGRFTESRHCQWTILDRCPPVRSSLVKV